MFFSSANEPRLISSFIHDFKTPCFDQILSEAAVGFVDRHLSLSDQLTYNRFMAWTSELSSFSDGVVGSVQPSDFRMLEQAFSKEFIGKQRAVIVQRCPQLPYEHLGISARDLPRGDAVSGLAYSGNYFIREELRDWQPVHFHELVHLTQREILGHWAYVGLHLVGLLKHGYRESPLEKMAYRLQNEFYGFRRPVDVEREVSNHLRRIVLGD